MVEPQGCLQRTGRMRTASGVTVYLMEELGDARLNAVQLKHYLDEARKIIEKSPARDHIFEVAGHLLQAIPEHLFKLEKSLQAVALAADRMDSEELKQDLKPDKVEELERALKEVRIRTVQHRSERLMPITPKAAAEDLHKIAAEVRTSGHLPVAAILSLATDLEDRDRTASDTSAMADVFTEMARALENPGDESPKRLHLASVLRRVLTDHVTFSDFAGKSASDDEEKESRFEEGKPADPTQNMSPEDAKKWKEEHAKNKDKFKEATDDEEKESRFEEGKPADPTQNMSPEDAAKWKKEHAKNKDKFKDKEAVSLRTRPFGEGISKDDLVAALFQGANEVYDARGGLRSVEQTLQDGREGYAARIGPLAGIDHSLWALAGNVKKAIYEWDHLTGDVARDMENLARKLKSAKAEVYASDDRTARSIDVRRLERVVAGVEEAAKQMRHSLDTYKRDPGKYEPQLDNIIASANDLGSLVRLLDRSWKSASGDGEKESRFEEGKPADPTQNMSPEDAKKWKEEHAKNKDKFKEGSASPAVLRTSYTASDWKEARYPITPQKFFVSMREAVQEILDVRVTTRDISQTLTNLANDATGVLFTDNYNDPKIRQAIGVLRDLDRAMGEGYQAIEDMVDFLKPRAKVAADDPWKVAGEAVSDEERLELRKDGWETTRHGDLEKKTPVGEFFLSNPGSSRSRKWEVYLYIDKGKPNYRSESLGRAVTLKGALRLVEKRLKSK